MSPIVGYHASPRKCRESILANGLLPNKPQPHRPYGVYVFRSDDSFDHLSWQSTTEWYYSWRADLWEAAYIGPLTMDHYVLNALVFLGPVEHVALVTGNND